MKISRWFPSIKGEICGWFSWDQWLISNTPPQVGSIISFIPSLLIIELNLRLRTPLVKTSASCNLEEINGVQIIPLTIFSFMKCLSILICFVLSYYTGLWAMLMVALLSWYNFIGPFGSIYNAINRFFIHINSHIPSTISYI